MRGALAQETARLYRQEADKMKMVSRARTYGGDLVPGTLCTRARRALAAPGLTHIVRAALRGVHTYTLCPNQKEQEQEEVQE